MARRRYARKASFEGLGRIVKGEIVQPNVGTVEYGGDRWLCDLVRVRSGPKGTETMKVFCHLSPESQKARRRMRRKKG